MNVPSQISLYDLLCMVVPGFVILWLINFCGLQLNNTLECAFIIILSYPVGMVYHRLIELLFNCSKKCWEKCLLQKTWEMENQKAPEPSSKQFTEIGKKDYNAAYYKIAKHNCLMNIPVLEAQEAFLRNSIPLLLLSIIKVACCYCNMSWHCHVIILLAVLLVATVFAWCFTQRKIFCLVWEGDHYLP